jgi:hypothetical protein
VTLWSAQELLDAGLARRTDSAHGSPVNTRAGDLYSEFESAKRTIDGSGLAELNHHAHLHHQPVFFYTSALERNQKSPAKRGY